MNNQTAKQQLLEQLQALYQEETELHNIGKTGLSRKATKTRLLKNRAEQKAIRTRLDAFGDY